MKVAPSGLNCEVSGKPDGLPLLLIHPLGADLRVWESCADFWRGEFRLIACDLPAAGGSPDGARPPTIGDQVDALMALVETLELRRFLAVGTAVGGMTAIALAARAAERAAGLVVTNPGLYIASGARAVLADRIARLQAGGMAAILPDAVDKPFNGLPHDARYRAYLERFARQDPLRYAHAIQGILDADVRPLLGRIACPLLIVCAEHEALMDSAHADALQAAVPGAERILLEDASHFLPYQAPERFAPLLSRFVRERIAGPTLHRTREGTI